MAKITFKCDGLEDIKKKLRKSMDLNAVKRVVKQNGSELEKGIVKNADFKGHFVWEKGKGKVFKSPTGKTKGSVKLTFEDSGLTAVSGPTTEYAPYVERGTRFMEAQPFVKPAFDKQKKQFKKDLQKLVR